MKKKKKKTLETGKMTSLEKEKEKEVWKKNRKSCSFYKIMKYVSCEFDWLYS